MLKNIEKLKQIGKLINTQNNRITDQPMFIVQKKVIDYGYDSEFCDDYKWINQDSGDYEEADEDKSKELEEIDDLCGDTEPFEKVYYKERWEFVTACFTERGCKDYISRNGHNLKEPRIYAEGSRRNKEYQTVRNALMELTDE